MGLLKRGRQGATDKDQKRAEKEAAWAAEDRALNAMADPKAEWRRVCSRCGEVWFALVHPTVMGAVPTVLLGGALGYLANTAERRADEQMRAEASRCPRCGSVRFTETLAQSD